LFSKILAVEKLVDRIFPLEASDDATV